MNINIAFIATLRLVFKMQALDCMKECKKCVGALRLYKHNIIVKIIIFHCFS